MISSLMFETRCCHGGDWTPITRSSSCQPSSRSLHRVNFTGTWKAPSNPWVTLPWVTVMSPANPFALEELLCFWLRSSSNGVIYDVSLALCKSWCCGSMSVWTSFYDLVNHPIIKQATAYCSVWAQLTCWRCCGIIFFILFIIFI